MTDQNKATRERRERRDALQVFVDGQIQSTPGDRNTIVQAVAKATREWIWTQPREAHRTYDEILASGFAGDRYKKLRARGRPTRDGIIEREVLNGGQLPLPQMQELIAWRWADRSGKTEKSVWKSTYGECAALDTDYENIVIDASAKRRYLAALMAFWREHRASGKPKDIENELVEDLYKRMGMAS
jgi:hypothetical protein